MSKIWIRGKNERLEIGDQNLCSRCLLQVSCEPQDNTPFFRIPTYSLLFSFLAKTSVEIEH